MKYSATLLEHYQNPRNVGVFDNKNPSIGTGVVGTSQDGDVIRLQIKVDEAGTIIDTRFKTYGCVASIASSSFVSEWLKGKSLTDAMAMASTDIAKALNLPPLKIHCSILATEAVKAAVANYHSKQD